MSTRDGRVMLSVGLAVITAVVVPSSSTPCSRCSATTARSPAHR
ncbi:hypothetical protein ACFQ60_16500 [Streptomyces zhihengii]